MSNVPSPQAQGLSAAALLGVLLAGSLFAPPAYSQEAPPQVGPPAVTISQGKAAPQRPDAATRTVRLFDFEEISSNPTLVPRFWITAQTSSVESPDSAERRGSREGFPTWNQAELDYTTPASRGRGSVRLPTTGGSTSLLLEPGVLPVLQNADYSITAMVRTHGLRHARACLAARFLDQASKPIPGSQVASDLMVSEDQWTPAAVELVGNFDDAAFIEIELLLLQPDRQGLAQRPMVAPAQDLSGAAWFDDVSVTQLPRIELTTNGPGNVIARPQSPELRLDVRDLTGETLRAQVTVLDAFGTVVDRASRSIGSGRAREPWRPRVPRLGWYRAVLRIFNDTSMVGQTSADFIWIAGAQATQPASQSPGAAALTDRRRFGLNVATLRAGLPAQLPEMLERVGTGAVIVPVWGNAPLPEPATRDAKPARTVLDQLIESGQDITLALDRLPPGLAGAARADPEDPWPVLRADPAIWDPYLGPLLEKYGQRVHQWMIGLPGDDRAFWRPGLAEDLAAIESGLGRLIPGPVLCVPWRIDRAPRADALAGPVQTMVAALVPQDSSAEEIAAFGALWEQSFGAARGPALTLVLESPPHETYGEAGLAELVKRTVEFWRAFQAPSGETPPAAAVLGAPWDWSLERRPKLAPRPELAVWSNLIRCLSGRRIVGRFGVTDGVTCYILAPAPGAPAGRTGALVAWNESAPPESAMLRDYLGDDPITVTDIFGNSAPAPTEALGEPADQADGSAQRQRRPSLAIPIGDQPIFIEGIDPALARFIGSVRIEPALLAATSDTHEHALVFDNPWPGSLDVGAYIVQPGGLDESGKKDRRWKITPRTARSITAAGQQGRIPLTISFSPAEEAGPKRFVIDLEVTADQPYGLVRLVRELRLGLEGFSLELTHAARDGRDVLVEAQVTNTSKDPINLELTASAPGLPRSKAPVSALPPGGTVVRRFPYPGALERLRGKRITVAVFDPESRARLNRTVLVE